MKDNLTIIAMLALALDVTLVADPALKPGVDAALCCHTLLLPGHSTPGTRDQGSEDVRFDRCPLTLRNDSDQPTVMRVMFIQNRPPDITIFTPVLCKPALVPDFGVDPETILITSPNFAVGHFILTISSIPYALGPSLLLTWQDGSGFLQANRG